MDVELQLRCLVDMARRMPRPCIDIINRVLMKGVGMGTLENMWQAGRVGQAEDAISSETVRIAWGRLRVVEHWNLRRLELRRADNGNALGHHDLIPGLRMQVPRAHETGLGGMRVDPAHHQEVLVDAVIQHYRLILCFASVGRASLLRNQKAADEQGVIYRCATEDATHFQPFSRVVCCDFQEGLAQLAWEKHWSDRVPVLEIRGWPEGQALLLLGW